jgi:hypothetical protein
MIDAMRAALKELEDVLDCINQDKIPFDGDDFHETLRTLRQAIAEAEKEATLQEIADIGQEAHTDHPMRHWDRTCPACVKQTEQWDNSDMAHRPGGLSVEQTEKQEKLCKYCGGIGRVVCNGRCMPEQEPVAWIYNGNLHAFDPTDWAAEPKKIQPLYLAPPNRPVKSYTGGEPQYATDAPQAEGEPWLGSPDHCSLHPDAPHGYNRKQSLKEHRYVCRCEGWRPNMSTKPENIDTKTGCVDRVDIEPVAYKYTDKTNHLVFYFTDRKDVTPNPDVIETALYTAPPKREWVGLTAEEIYNCWQSAVDENGFTKRKVYDAIEAKLKEKNT